MVEEREGAGEGAGLVLAVEGAEDSVAGDSLGALSVRGDGLGHRVVGVGSGIVVRADVEETLEVAVGGRWVLSVVLGTDTELGL